MNRPIDPQSSSNVTTKKKGLPGWLNGLIALALLAGGIGAAVTMVKTKAKPTKSDEVTLAPLVEITTAKVGTKPVSVQLNGEVQPARRVVVMPEVGGRVTWQSSELVPGGIIKKGAPLVRLDARDYALAVKQQQAQLATQKLNLRVEKGRKTVAEKEWDLFNRERREAGLPPLEEAQGEDEGRLALRDPQMQSARVAVKSAESALDRSRLALGKTTLTAPFNAFVQTENVDEGQLVSPGYQLATLVGTDAFWIQVSIPVDKLAFIKFPQGKEPGSPAKIVMDTAGGNMAREGHVIRLLGDLDPVGRLARILIEVEDPFMQKAPAKDETAPAGPRIPLLIGSYVRAEIEGVELEGVAEVPRIALQEGDRLFVLDQSDKLDIRKVTVVWGDDERVVINGNVKDGERLIVTNLATPVAGMTLRVAGELAEAEPQTDKSAEPTTSASPTEG